MPLSNEETSIAIQSAARIVEALIEHTPTFKGRADAKEQGEAAAKAFEIIFAKIESIVP